jgi:tRNA G10  N-methylase Trm11
MRLVFILGNHPALSAAEILKVTGLPESAIIAASPSILIIEGDFSQTPAQLQSILGGTIKIGTIITELTADTLTKNPEATIVSAITEYSLAHAKPPARWTFGVSAYAAGGGIVTSPHGIGMKTKDRLTNENADFRARVVVPSEGTALTSAAVLKNKLLQDGAEFLILRKGFTTYIAVTNTIQPLEDFSNRDYGRPGRDTHQGMLPPKLARMMINIAGIPKHKSILDPFCGSGTILTESLQLGYKTVFGSDKNPDAIKATNTNIKWMADHKIISLEDTKVDAVIADARNLGKNHPNQTVGGIVTEPFMGPPLRGGEKRGELQQTLFSLGHLYYEAFSAWQPILETNARILMLFPTYKIRTGYGHNTTEESHAIDASQMLALGYERIEMISPSLSGRLNAAIGKNRGLLYGRADQHVWRELVLFRRK